MILKSAIKFYLESKTINKLHSPIAYKLVRQLFDHSKTYYDDYSLEQVRSRLLKNKEQISFLDLGAGSNATGSKMVHTRVCDLARRSSSNRYKCRLIRNAIMFFQPDSILELGTNLGMATAYMHSADKNATVVTVEGSPEISELAKENFQSLGYKTIKLINQPFDEYIASGHQGVLNSELVYLDGNHRYECTLAYIDKVWSDEARTKVAIVDDINWSPEMNKAWEEIRHRRDCHSIDLFKMGIIFKDERIPESSHYSCIPRKLKPWQMGFFG